MAKTARANNLRVLKATASGVGSHSREIGIPGSGLSLRVSQIGMPVSRKLRGVPYGAERRSQVSACPAFYAMPHEEMLVQMSPVGMHRWRQQKTAKKRKKTPKTATFTLRLD